MIVPPLLEFKVGFKEALFVKIDDGSSQIVPEKAKFNLKLKKFLAAAKEASQP
jgi:hypothetical protein